MATTTSTSLLPTSTSAGGSITNTPPPSTATAIVAFNTEQSVRYGQASPGQDIQNDVFWWTYISSYWGQVLHPRNATDSTRYLLSEGSPELIAYADIHLVEACQLPQNGSFDCTRACNDTESLFTSNTLGACIVIGTAALLVQNNSFMLSNDSSTVRIIENWNIPNLETFDATSMFDNVLECLTGSCYDQNLGSCDESILALRNFTVNANNIASLEETISMHYCAQTASPLNSDIAGPGVILSYLMQTAMVFLFSILLKFLTAWSRPFIWPFAWIPAQYKRLRGQGVSGSLSDAWAYAQRSQNRLDRSRFNSALIYTTIEFQEVQGYFIAAIQIATLVIFQPGPTADGSTTNGFGVSNTPGMNMPGIDSYSMALVNAKVVQMLAIYGVLPMLLMQATLQRAGMRWWYTLGVTTIVFVLSLVVNSRAENMLPKPDVLWEYWKRERGLDVCGGNPSPMTFCLDRTASTMSSFVSDNAVELCILLWVSLFVDQLSWTVWCRLPSPMRNMWVDWMQGRKSRRVLGRYVWPACLSIYWLTLLTFLMTFLGSYMLFIVTLILQSGIVDGSKWGYGQLIAVMVWAPTIGKWLYFNIFGIKEGLHRRLSKHWRVVRADDVSECTREHAADPAEVDSLTNYRDVYQGIQTSKSRSPTFLSFFSMSTESETQKDKNVSRARESDVPEELYHPSIKDKSHH